MKQHPLLTTLVLASLMSSLLVAPMAWSKQTTQDDRHSEDTDQEKDRIVVTSDFRGTELSNLAASVTLIDAASIEERNASHLEDIINIAPNVNFATGASRGRFFQIRGIGARSQFVEPTNASVGLLIDGIDLTGLGGGATTLDIDQVEILRGPQGTLFGANALAGMINMVSGAPTQTTEGQIGVRVGDYGTRYLDAIHSGPLQTNLAYRLAVSHNESAGFTNNKFLGVRDTAHIDEQTLRGKLHWELSPDLKFDFTGLYLNIDNGYDAFSLDNTRTTLSDQPGFDRQETVAGSMKMKWLANDAFNVEALVSAVNADLDYAYDEDWAFDAICDVFECIFGGYTSFDQYTRQTENATLDVRAISNTDENTLGWVLGAYAKDQSQALDRVYTYASDFSSDYDTTNRALYGQLNIPLAADWALTSGLRFEHFDADYFDSNQARYAQDENLWGGNVSLEHTLDGGQLVYALISKGYKAGGINPDADVPETERRYQTEGLWNHELGTKLRLFDGRFNVRAAVFYQQRDDIQTQQSLVIPIQGDLCPCEFIEFQSNAAKGSSYGLELELNGRINDRLGLFASVGLLNATFDDFVSFSHVDADEDTGMGVNLDGRDVPQAPNYMAHVGAVMQLSDRWSLKAELEAKDGFYFSSRHSTRADAYELAHLRLGYEANGWDVALWVRNVFDQTIKTRGFGGFGNDPRKGYATEPYYQFGAPRTMGISGRVRF